MFFCEGAEVKTVCCCKQLNWSCRKNYFPHVLMASLTEIQRQRKYFPICLSHTFAINPSSRGGLTFPFVCVMSVLGFNDEVWSTFKNMMVSLTYSSTHMTRLNLTCKLKEWILLHGTTHNPSLSLTVVSLIQHRSNRGNKGLTTKYCVSWLEFNVMAVPNNWDLRNKHTDYNSCFVLKRKYALSGFYIW